MNLWHIVPIMLLLILALGLVYAFSLYTQQEGLLYRKVFESQIFWAQENVENRVAHMRKKALEEGDAIVKKDFNADTIKKSASEMLTQYPELNRVSWFDARGQWVYGVDSDKSRNESVVTRAPANGIQRETLLSFIKDQGQNQTIAECLVPIPTTHPNGQMMLAGFLQLRTKIDDLLVMLLPNEVTQQNLIKL